MDQLGLQLRQFDRLAVHLVYSFDQGRLGGRDVQRHRRGRRRHAAAGEPQRVHGIVFYYLLACGGLLCGQHVCGRHHRQLPQMPRGAAERTSSKKKRNKANAVR